MSKIRQCQVFQLSLSCIFLYLFCFIFCSDPSISIPEASDCKATVTAASSDISSAPSGGQEVLSSETSVADQTDSATLGPEAEKQPALCPAVEDASAPQEPVAVVVNGAEEKEDKGKEATGPTEAPETTFDPPKFTPALLQALLQECKSRSAQRGTSESKGEEKEASPNQRSLASPQRPAPTDRDAELGQDQEMVSEISFCANSFYSTATVHFSFLFFW